MIGAVQHSNRALQHFGCAPEYSSGLLKYPGGALRHFSCLREHSIARELRDRWLEHVNSAAPALPGKYDLSRRLSAPAERAPLLLPPSQAA